MKVSFWVALIAVAFCAFVAALFNTSSGAPDLFFVAFGLMCLIVGVLAALIGLGLYIARSMEYSQAFFLTTGVLLVLGTSICGSMAMGLWDGF